MDTSLHGRVLAAGCGVVLPVVLAAAGCHRATPAPPTRPVPVGSVVAVPVDVPATPGADVPPVSRPMVREEPPSCRLEGAPQPLGSNAEVTSITVSEFAHEGQPVWGVAWIVPPRHLHGPDDIAAVEFTSFDETPQRIDPEEPSDAQGLARSPTAVVRAYVHPSGNSYASDSDRISRDDAGNEIVECGDLSQELAAVDPTASDGIARTLHPGAMFFCRTAYNVSRPFVLGLRGADANPMPGTARFFATRATTVPSSRGDFWPTSRDASALVRARDPAAALRDTAPDGLDITEIPGTGYAVTFRQQHRLWLGWLDLTLHPIGELRPMATLGGEPGRPRVVADGTRALVVFADRAATPPDAGPPAYTIRYVLAPYGQDPGEAVPLPMDLQEPTDAFAAAAVALPDGSWVVTFTRGPVDARAPSDHQHVYARRYSPAMAPLGASVLVSGGVDASDARAMLTPRGVEVAMAVGHGATRAVVLQQMVCGNPRDAGR